MVKKTKLGTDKAQFRDRLRAWAKDFYQRDFDALTTRLQSQAFARFYVEEIHNASQNEIGTDDFDAGWVDAAGDLNIDLLHRDDGRVLILQSRYHNAKHNESPGDISHFQNVLARLYSGQFSPNPRLTDLASGIDWENDSFAFVYLTLGKLDGQALKQSEMPATYPDELDDINLRCDWHFLDESQLNVELRNAIQLRAGVPQTELTIHSTGQKGKRSDVVEVDAGPYKSYVLVVDAMQLIRAYQSCKRDALFTMNVRSFIGNTKYNKKIIETARTRPADFFFFNNGISCIAESVQRGTGSIVVTKLQVINGAQTIRSLVRATQGGKTPGEWQNTPPLILMRVTDVGPYHKTGTRMFREEITRYNNTQNVVKDSDFRSNDKVQNDLKEQFAKIRRHGKQCVYVPKRTDEIKRDAEVIRLEEFSKTVFSVLDNPAKFSGSTSYLFDEQKGYPIVFLDPELPMSISDFRVRAAIWWMGKEFGIQIKKDRAASDDSKVRQALERKWFVLHAARLFLEKFYGAEWQDKLGRHYQGDWELGQDKVGQAFNVVYEFAKGAVVFMYQTDSNQPNFVHRNWMRSESTANQLRSYVFTQPVNFYQQAIAAIG